jgi:hypothetical protein
MSRSIVYVFTLAALLLPGCTSKARLHNLDTGEVIPIQLNNYGIGEGEVIGRLPNGKEAKGAHVLMVGGAPHWRIHDCQLDSVDYQWATSQGVSFDQPHTKYGYGVLVADGKLIKIMYAIGQGTSYGCGIDESGRKYRLVF